VERIALILKQATGFVYYVSREGVTGMQAQVAGNSESRIELIRQQTSLPICIGFGISTPEQARTVSHQADGAVIGSALVSRIAEWGRDADLARKLEDFARPLAEAIHS
jgi:tryptophan synthase alpha chain